MDILETRLHRTMVFIVNIFFLGVLLLATSLLVVTAFPALAAAFGVVRDWTRSQHTDVLRPFIHHFGATIGHSLIIGLLWTLVGTSLAVNLQLSGQLAPAGLRLPVLIVAVALSLAFLAVSVFVFPVLVHYDVDWRAALRNAVLFAVGRPPVTVACLCLVAAAGVVTWALPVLVPFTAAMTVYGVYRLCDTAFTRADQQIRRAPGSRSEASHGDSDSPNGSQ